MLIDQVKREYKAHTLSLANQRAFDSGHHTGTNANPLSDYQFAKRLNTVSANVRAKKLDFGVSDRARLSILSNDCQHPGRLQHFYTFL